MSTIQDPKKTWLATGNLLTFWWRMPCLGLRLPFAFMPCLPPACPSASSGVQEGLVHSRLAVLWYLLNLLFCEQARLHLRLELFVVKFSLSLSLSLSLFSLWLSHSLGCYLTHSGLVLTLSMQPKRPCSAPCSLVADLSVWATSPLGVAFRHIFCVFFFIFYFYYFYFTILYWFCHTST